jgi:hypothetical protein
LVDLGSSANLIKLTCLSGILLGTIYTIRPPRSLQRNSIWSMLFISTLGIWLAQQKTFDYHLFPLLAASCALMGLFLSAANGTGLLFRIAIFCMMYFVCHDSILYLRESNRRAVDPMINTELRAIADLESHFSSVNLSQIKFQFLDDPSGGAHFLLKHKIHNSTPYIYAFQFFAHDPTKAFIIDLRRRLLDSIEKSRPDFIVISHLVFPSMLSPLDLLPSFPELDALLQTDYSPPIRLTSHFVWQSKKFPMD